MEAFQKEISQLIAEAFLYLHADWLRVSEQFGLTLFQFWTLIHLDNPEGLSPGMLARLVLCDKSSMTHVIDDLEARNLVVRERSKDGDRRSQRIVLTDRGKSMRASLLSAQSEHAAKQAQVLNETEMRELCLILQRFLKPLRSS